MGAGPFGIKVNEGPTVDQSQWLALRDSRIAPLVWFARNACGIGKGAGDQ